MIMKDHEMIEGIIPIFEPIFNNIPKPNLKCTNLRKINPLKILWVP